MSTNSILFQMSKQFIYKNDMFKNGATTHRHTLKRKRCLINTGKYVENQSGKISMFIYSHGFCWLYVIGQC